jgi:hypothetical protein
MEGMANGRISGGEAAIIAGGMEGEEVKLVYIYLVIDITTSLSHYVCSCLVHGSLG